MDLLNRNHSSATHTHKAFFKAPTYKVIDICKQIDGVYDLGLGDTLRWCAPTANGFFKLNILKSFRNYHRIWVEIFCQFNDMEGVQNVAR